MIPRGVHLLVCERRQPASRKEDAMNAAMSPQALGTASTSVSTPVAVREAGSVSGAPLALLRLEGAAALAGAALAYSALGGRWSMFALLFLVPDLSMLGYLAGR